MFTYIVITILLVVLECVYFKIADKFNIIDKPNLRSSHTSITLRGGGIIFLIGVWLYAIFFGFQYLWFILGMTAISLVSFVDDIHSVPNKYRLIVQFASMFMMFEGLGILGIDTWWQIIVALILCVGIINAYNFMDGINGITGGYSMAILLPLLYLNQSQPFMDKHLIVVMMLSVLVFCFFNFRKKAKCFAGDVGAIGIAFVMIFMVGKLILATGNFVYLLFFAVYGVDTILTIIHRIMLHENIGQAHRKHAFQLMANELHMPHVAVSLFYTVLQLLVSSGLILLPVNKWIYFVAACIVLGIAYILFMKKYYHLHEAYLKTKGLES